MKTSHLILLLGLLSVSSLASAQQPAGTWHHFINSSTPRCMIADGPYLWVGTDGGLIKFNRGSGTFEVLTTDNSGLPDNAIFRLMLDRQHDLWVSTENGGLARMQNGVWTVFNLSNSPLPSSAGGIPACDSLGRVWVATVNGLLKYDAGKWSKYDMSNAPMSDPWLEAITADRHGNIWIGTRYRDTTIDRGFILKFDGTSTWQVHNDTLDGFWLYDTTFDTVSQSWKVDTVLGYGIMPENPWSLLVDDSDNLFVGFGDAIDRHVPGVGWEYYDITPTVQFGQPNYVTSLVQDGGYIWGADEVNAVRINDTLSRYADIKQYPWKKDGSGFPFYGTCSVVSVDSELWFAGNGGGGIGRYKDSAWTLYRNLSNVSLSSNNVGAITIDKYGKCWFSQRISTAHLSAFDGTTWQNFDTVLHGAPGMSLCADSSGNIWIGTAGNGLIKFDGEHVQTYDLNKLAHLSNVISSLAFDKRGILWIGTQWQGGTVGLQSGLAEFDGTHWTADTLPTSPIPEAQITSLAIDTAGTLWIGTPFTGLATLDAGNNWALINPANSALPSNSISGIASAPNGDVWVATDKGASKWNGKVWTTYSSGPLEGISGCAIDTQGHAWFSSYGGGGASEFDGTTWTTFTPTNSLIGSYWVQDVVADRHGDVWFGTDGNGVVEYIPTSPASVAPTSSGPTSALAIYPNPFTKSTTIAFTSAGGFTQVSIVNVLGVEVARLFEGSLETGKHSFTWNAGGVVPGMYECVVQQAGVMQHLPIMLLK